MKRFHIKSRLFATGVALIFLTNLLNAQVNGFAMSCPGTTQTAGSSFPVNLSFNWTNTTSNATVTLNYNPAVVSYDNSCQNVLPSCMTVTNNSTTGVLTVTMSSLAACTNTGSISFNVCFRFLCPDTCAGVNKTAAFTASLTDNLGTTQNASCSVTGNTPNNWILQHAFHSYNSLTAEVTYKAYYNNPGCFRVKNPKFNVSLSGCAGASITQAWGFGYTYTISGATLTPSTTVYNTHAWDTLYYVVKLPCNTCNNQTLSSAITLLGDNCNVANSTIKGPVTASYTLPVAPAPNPAAVITKASYTSPNRFYTRIANTGNTPLNLQHDEYLPLVHVINTPSVIQNTNQPGINNTVQYYNCSSTPGTTYPLVGNGATNNNAPTNTTRIRFTINNLLPGNYVDVLTYFDLSSSCSGPVGSSPYKDSSVVTYNCAAPSNTCINCGTGGGQITGVSIYNPQPILNCFNNTSVTNCKSVGDTVDFCFEFRNVGDAPLTSGQIDLQLPGWLQYLSGSATYTGFTTNPTVVPSSNVKFSLPVIPVGSTTYKICYKAVVGPGATGGTNWVYIYYNGSGITGNQYICANGLNICAYAAIGIEKKVKGSLDGSFGTSGNGVAGSLVDYEVTIRNTGTIAVNNLVVIDRFPSSLPQDLTILGSPLSISRGSQFNMTPGPTPSIPGTTVTYSNVFNICTGWTGVGTNCNVGTWGASGNASMRVVFNPSTTLAPGAMQTFTFQLQIPAGTPAGLFACNSAGFNATSVTGGYTINPVESPNVCVEVKSTATPPPPGCCRELLKSIKAEPKVDNNTIHANLTLAAGPKKLKKVTVSLVQFEVKHPEDCNICVKDPRLFGNMVPGSNTLPWSTVPASVPFTHMMEWKDSIGKDWSSGVPIKFDIPLPPKSPIACCCDTITYCLRYTITDIDCNTCDTVICYTAYNGKDCNVSTGGGNENPICNCNLKPILQFDGAGGHGTKDVVCGGSITLPAGNTYTSMIPNFTCKDQNGKDCEGGGVTVTIKKPDNTTQVLTGPSYSYHYAATLPGVYEYTIVGTCGGKKCECKFRVIIPNQ